MNKPINSLMYAVHKRYADSKTMFGGTVRVCRIKTYKNIEGKICPILKVVGESLELDTTNHYIYNTLDEAIEVIKTK